VNSVETEVRDYYDLNTALWFKRERESHAIHRAVWGPGVASTSDAFHFLDRMVLAEVTALQDSGRFAGPLHVLDLGCGVGGSLIFLASHTNARATGVTLSGVQASYAAARIDAARLADRVACLTTSFLALPASLDPAHLAFSIEAFVHGPDPAAYFESAGRQILPGGILLVCDDFLTARALKDVTSRDARTIGEVRDGWLAQSLITLDEANALAGRAGFSLIKNIDLTPSLDLRRPRDLIVSLAVALGRYLPLSGYRWRSLVGGNALQIALVRGLIEFRCAVWRRDDAVTNRSSAFYATR
jgi:cyclopropane fatty-acyl-phospholipid synthase-like methyltransferase